MQKVKVALFQYDILNNNPKGNREYITQYLNENNLEADLLILPETFTTGFSTDGSAPIEPHNGPTVEWMKILAHQYNAAIGGGIFVSDGQSVKNRFYWVEPDGKLVYYDKAFIFGPGGEAKICTAGKRRVVVTYLGVRFLLTTCYDLRFPLWTRQKEDYDVMINIANWPKKRAPARKILLQARAIENQVFVIAVNRIGKDIFSYDHQGQSMIVGPDGKIIIDAQDREGLIYHKIDLAIQKSYREQLPFYRDAKDYTINLS